MGYADTVVIRRWLVAGRPDPLIILVEELRPSPLPFPRTPRSYLTLDDGVERLAETFSKPLAEVREAARLWTASLVGPRRELISAELATSSLITQLGATARGFELDSSQLETLVPAQSRSALSFNVELGKIGLRNVVAPQATTAILSGAARSLCELSDDLSRSSSLGNIVAGYDRKLARISNVARRMADAEAITDNDVLELGIQISALEALINGFQEQLGQQSTGEALIFFLEARSFLAQFPTWADYQHRSPDRAAIEAPELEAALAIFRSFSAASGVLTQQAKDRVEEVVPDARHEKISNELEGKSLTDSATNLSKVAAQSVIKGARELPAEVGKDISKDLARKLSKLIVENSGNLIRIAAANREQWLDLAISFAKQHLGL